MKRNLEILKMSLSGLSKTAMLLLIVLFGGFNHRVSNIRILDSLSMIKDVQLTAVLLNNQQHILPFKDLAQRRIASVNFGAFNSVAFDKMLRNYAAVTSFNSDSFTLKDLREYTTLIIQVTPQSVFSSETLSFIREIQRNKEVIIAGFGNTTALQTLDAFTIPLIWNPHNTVAAVEQSAAIIFGGVSAEGRLNESVSPRFSAGAGYTTSKIRLKYAIPEDLSISSARLNKIDDIVNSAISEHATPSAVVMVVKDGNVIFNKAYGSHTYDGDIPTQTTDIYDV
ncbi:MAG: beta-N-acetylglucosaminidase, partial [Pyrinomonadaceae bacterium]|nr:beta-N-acetylglucosaminidase [Sphingobacteriaceae bacterium]